MKMGDAGITRYVASGVVLAFLALLIMPLAFFITPQGSVSAVPPCPKVALSPPGFSKDVTPLRVSQSDPLPPRPLSPCPSGPVKFTYLGGPGDEMGTDAAFDAAGYLIVAGWTTSANFPTTPGAFDTTPSAGGDIFIAKFDADVTTLIAATLVGGSAYEDAKAMAVDGAGNIYLVGHTQSADFPTTPGTYDDSLAGARDMILMKFDPTLSTLLYSTYLGDSLGDFDLVTGLTLDASGNAYLTGLVYSPGYPVTPGAYDTLGDSVGDAFVTKINPAGNGPADLVYSTFLGGDAEDWGRSIVVDSSGNAYVAGRTYSANFPTTGGAFDTTFNGQGSDSFVSKLNPSGTGLVYSTFLGGRGNDDAWGVAIDGAGNAYVTGRTDASTFPTTAGAFDTTFNGKPGSTPSDAYVTKLNAAGSGLVYSTFLGGKAGDLGRKIVVDEDGSAYVVGHTASSGYPVTADGFDTSYNGNADAFLTRLNAAGSALVYSSFLGGTAEDQERSLAVNSLGHVYLTGYTVSTNFPVTPGAYDTSHNGGWDVFAGRMA